LDNPLRYIDLLGTEGIVVTGGIADSDMFNYQFVEPSIKNIRDGIANGTPESTITWMVIDAGYTPKDIDNFRDTAEKLGVNFVPISDKYEFISYINEKNGYASRRLDPITSTAFYSHGQSPIYSGSKENQLSFAYGIADLGNRNASDINFTQSDIASLDSDAFNKATTIFFSCNSGTKDSHGNSFAQTWSNKTGGASYGIQNGRTLYSLINVAGSLSFSYPSPTFAVNFVNVCQPIEIQRIFKG
jgi:hypothetical protein